MKKPRDKHIWKPNLDIQTENIRKPPLILSLNFLSYSIYRALLASLLMCLFLCFSFIASNFLPLTDYRAGSLSDNKTPVRWASRHKYLSHQKPPKRLSCLTPNDEER